ncbi:MAG TPA: glycosyltransferase family 4 protein [Solirubrobacteraceae bacterium]|nr:glycosyltransferase family 4 protein [Solirubrobacteraceae bacterium]
MKVLYVSHTAVVSGAERSLLDLLGALPRTVAPLLATPPGPLQVLAQERGIATTAIVGTAGSLRLHPLHTPRALAQMAVAGWQVRRAAARHGADVVHANSIRAGIVLAFARLRATATIVHVRDCLPRGRVSTATLRLIAATATTVVANSAYTAASVLAAAPSARVEVVHNAVDLRRFDPEAIDRAEARTRLGRAGERRLLLGVVAQLSPWKGQDTAIEALSVLCREGLDAQLLLVGSAKFVASSTRFDNEDYVARLHELVAAAGLGDRVSWLGEREDVAQIVRALDVLLLPSWEEPFGRALIEAMALGVPVVATDVGGPREIVQEGRQGYLVAPRQPDAWAHAIARVAQSADGGAAMGRAGRQRAAQLFTIARHVHATLDCYERAIAQTGGRPV